MVAPTKVFPGRQGSVLYRPGEGNPHARLTEAQVISARRRARTSPGCVAELARQWNVSPEGLRQAVQGVNWKYLDAVAQPVRQRAMSPRHEYSDEERRDLLFFVRTMIAAGATVVDAAANVGIADPTARLWLRTYG
ncbi:hypothetical protein CVAR_2307 [Corynebacterium variabile DSM 44702]|uniref:Uncharacterized protein n=1 Tax=Corynebacterium variabile (strain DSM 44702 / CIP 107183 / JCM 12073 / NCIMB 30131) TaxID=858619 RepID=G0HGP5_CORVD|nr:hypothetical protein [Corynebacterium variabile]AEK37652.1 hypothetical protein CVAR_2307 [Corynebacterium variabile DSM 44702]